MKKSCLAVSTLALCAVSASVGLAADAPQGPPKVLQIIREEVKPGKGAAHEKIEEGWPAAFRKADFPGYYLAMTSVTGPSEAWFVEAWGNFEEAEKAQAAVDTNATLKAVLDGLSQKDGELLSRTSAVLARYRADLSYRPEFDAARMRFFEVMTYRAQPGHEADLVALVKLITDAHTKANVEEHWVSYEVVSGSAAGTFLVFTPMRSMSEYDTDEARHGKAFADALGEEGQKKLGALMSATTQKQETALFAFSPKMSYVSKNFAARDPEFWTPKPAPVAAAKKEAPKK